MIGGNFLHGNMTYYINNLFMTVIELNIKKIWCTMCVEKIQKAFCVAGIQSVLVNIISENVIISFDPALM